MENINEGIEKVNKHSDNSLPENRNKVSDEVNHNSDSSIPENKNKVSDKVTYKKWFESFYVILRNKLEESSMHGIPNIIRSDRAILKIVWLIILLASISYCAYLMWMSIQTYLRYPVVTNIDKILQIPTSFRNLKKFI